MLPTHTVRFTATARRDLLDIFVHLATVTPGNAAKVTSDLSNAIDSLAWFPGRYKVVRASPTAARIVRAMSHPPYVVYYRIRERAKAVEIATIRHGARLPPRRF